MLILLTFLPLLTSLAFAETTWTVFLSQYDGTYQKELFSPIELPIKSEDKVIWINYDSTAHKIVSGVPAHPDHAGTFFSTGVLKPGQSNSVVLKHTDYGAYYYFCEIHPWFTGKIFFEEFSPFSSTQNISVDVNEDKKLEIKGNVDSELGTTQYEILIYNSKDYLIFHTVKSFTKDASFDVSIDTSSSIWAHDNDYVLKLVYGVPSEATIKTLHIPIFTDKELQKKSYDLCKNMADKKTDFVFEDVYLPYWYKDSVCWFGNALISSQEIYDGLDFFTKSSLQ
ncbi:Hypothetical protein Nlim_0492 [Candidatus Nitrosarchaeum limnium SFB1]|jgi:plastocyanin|uniref:Blue (type 1) copper domain-containing protein n=1 Tax=Candidatus Nitrosarchaeum limnium SFB1 TaxID=886738 RepID=F3KJ37_9ARCH|nr:Hypothetical protein Nlim_0492 [Candidatus Nitrosarchaeum limnium SFB1]